MNLGSTLERNVVITVAKDAGELVGEDHLLIKRFKLANCKSSLSQYFTRLARKRSVD
jgi:hypothetical protein